MLIATRLRACSSKWRVSGQRRKLLVRITALKCCSPLAGLHGESQREESNANQKRDEDAGLLCLIVDEQYPPGERQLAEHLERLPPDGVTRQPRTPFISNASLSNLTSMTKML
eukprot:4557996-Prymnesium_polylepis.1